MSKEKKKYWTDIKQIKNRCKYCGKELPDGVEWWCNSIHRFWEQVCGKRRMGKV